VSRFGTPQITATIREILHDSDKSASVNYAGGGKQRFCTLREIAGGGGGKNRSYHRFWKRNRTCPFSIDEVVWDYQLVGGGSDEELQVVLVAIKSDLLEVINAAVEAAGRSPRGDRGRNMRSTTPFVTTTAR